MIRVVVADDHPSVRYGIQSLLKRASDVDVIGEAVDGEEAVERIKALSPDVVVMDITMPRMDGIRATELTAGLTHVLIISVHTDTSLVEKALEKGARGYLAKRNLADRLLLAIRTVNMGHVYLCPEIKGSLGEEE